ncbi:PP2C family protein-serine/threonine phosphatase [Konateibacter massiliensis]|uniref:PP2C family protein-serine/threonine phosphatase n=1 Tax=Konateibacter massiliensis TaxID=2002841 RepID=UPI000C15F868|nr:protein phosphatase 2C domain-containing protein [Konateibacter massiliensis]
MDFVTVACSDIGIKKKVNQDSYCIKSARTCIGNILMAVICDGMGGLAKGEVASASVVTRFSKWFDLELPKIVEDFSVEAVKQQWQKIVKEQNHKIKTYGESLDINLGTTLTVLLIVDEYYAIIGHVGDSRAYKINSTVQILTEDQTIVAREMKENKLTAGEAELDPRRNILLQCIGASKTVLPDYIVEGVEPNSIYMLCTDGFRHKITEEEIFEYFNPTALTDEKSMKSNSDKLVELNKKRLENDNITVLLIKVV